MAFDATPDDEEQGQPGQPGSLQTGSSPTSAGQAQSLGPQGGLISPGPAGAGGAGKPTSSGNFTNLEDYLNANANSGFGSQLANQVLGEVNQANSSQQQAQQGFQNAVTQGQGNFDPNLISNAQNNPTQFVQNQNDLDQWNSQLNAQYQGPTSVSQDVQDYNPAYQATQNAEQAANALQTDNGRYGLLNQYYGAGVGNSNYSQGQQNLDDFLVNADPNFSQAAQNAQTQANQSQTNWNNYVNSGGNGAIANAQNYDQGIQQNAQNAAQNFGNEANNLLYGNGGSASNVLGGYQGQLNADQTAATKAASTLANDYSSNKYLLPQDLLGLSGTSNLQPGQDYGVNWSQYASPNAMPSLNQITTSDQQAQLNALQQLSGQAPTVFGGGTAGQYVGSNGSVTYNPVNFNAPAYQQALQNAQGAYNQQVNAPQTYADPTGYLANGNFASNTNIPVTYSNLNTEQQALQNAINSINQMPSGAATGNIPAEVSQVYQNQLGSVDQQIQQLYNQFGILPQGWTIPGYTSGGGTGGYQGVL